MSDGVSGIYGVGKLYRVRSLWRPDPSSPKRKKLKKRSQIGSERVTGKPKAQSPDIPLGEKIKRLEKARATQAQNAIRAREQYRRAVRDRDAGRFGNVGTFETASAQVKIAERRLSTFERHFHTVDSQLKVLVGEEIIIVSDARNVGEHFVSSVEAPHELSVQIPSDKTRYENENIIYASRDGQADFRCRVVKAYGSCSISGCSDEAALQAAHIIPYVDARSNLVTNGICLRADLHCLFDRGLLEISPEYLISVAPQVRSQEYRALHGKRLHLPGNRSEWPETVLLAVRHKYI